MRVTVEYLEGVTFPADEVGRVNSNIEKLARLGSTEEVRGAAERLGESVEERKIVVFRKGVCGGIFYRVVDNYVIKDRSSDRDGCLGCLGSEEYSSEDVEAM